MRLKKRQRDRKRRMRLKEGHPKKATRKIKIATASQPGSAEAVAAVAAAVAAAPRRETAKVEGRKKLATNPATTRPKLPGSAPKVVKTKAKATVGGVGAAEL